MGGGSYTVVIHCDYYLPSIVKVLWGYFAVVTHCDYYLPSVIKVLYLCARLVQLLWRGSVTDTYRGGEWCKCRQCKFERDPAV